MSSWYSMPRWRGLGSSMEGLESSRGGLESSRGGLEPSRGGLESSRGGLESSRGGLESSGGGLEPSRGGPESSMGALKASMGALRCVKVPHHQCFTGNRVTACCRVQESKPQQAAGFKAAAGCTQSKDCHPDIPSCSPTHRLSDEQDEEPPGWGGNEGWMG